MHFSSNSSNLFHDKLPFFSLGKFEDRLENQEHEHQMPSEETKNKDVKQNFISFL